MLVLCLIITLSSALIIRDVIRREEDSRFRRATESILEAINTRLRVYENVLMATRGLFDSQPHVSRAQFHSFISSLELEIRFPGLQAIGFSQAINQKDLHSHVRKIQKQGFPDYHVWPDSSRDQYNSILFIEPFDWRNQRAFGFDMSTEPVRRQAMAEARDSGEPKASGRVTLVQETDHDTQIGFLIYVPVYKMGLPTGTVEQRRKALLGFVYSPFRTGDLLSEIQREVPEQFSRLEISIFDGEKADPANQLFDSTDDGLSGGSILRGLFRKAFITTAGRVWTVTFEPTEKFTATSSRGLPVFILVVGTFISFLIFFIFRFSHRLNEQLLTELEIKESAQKEILKAREEAVNANKAKSLFLANMSHEIRTPLGVILGFCDLAQETANLPEEIRNFLQVIKRNAQSLVTLVGEVLDLSKIEANKLEVEKLKFSLPDVLEEIISSLDLRAREKGIELTFDKRNAIPECVVTDPTKLRQILMNLIGNAIKFTHKGYVRLTPRMLSKPIRGTPMELEFLIEDSGIGLSPESQKKLFQPFSQADTSMTRKYGGTGLGLVLSQKLARALGGDVQLVQSEPEKGSLFSFRLEAGPFENFWHPTPSMDESAHAQTESQERALKNKKILLVEDSLDNQVLVGRYLRAAGAKMDVASDGAEAIERALENSYDAVLMDIQMPHMDGHEATERLRKSGYRAPILALTAHAFREERERALQGGFNAYLTKPIQRQKLIEELLSAIKTENASPKTNSNHSSTT